MHFPAEIAVLKNSANAIFQKRFCEHMVTGPAEILISFRTFSEKWLFYKCFYKNIYWSISLSTIPWFHGAFKGFIEISEIFSLLHPFLSSFIMQKWQKRKR